MHQDEYRKYMRSDVWRTIRRLALEHAEHRCQICNRPGSGLQAHHRTYERLGRERLSDLVVLCARCHARHHDQLDNTHEAAQQTPAWSLSPEDDELLSRAPDPEVPRPDDPMEAVVWEVREHAAMVGTAFDAAVFRELDGDVLRWEFAETDAFQLRTCTTPTSRSVIVAAAERAFGRPIAVHMQFHDPGAAQETGP